MAVGFGDLITAVRTKMVGDAAFASLNGNVYFAAVPEGTPKPSCRLSSVSDSYQGMYGGLLLDHWTLQFSFFGSLSDVNALTKAVRASFHGAVLSVGGGVNVCTKRADSMGPVADFSSEKPGASFVYHGAQDVEFLTV